MAGAVQEGQLLEVRAGGLVGRCEGGHFHVILPSMSFIHAISCHHSKSSHSQEEVNTYCTCKLSPDEVDQNMPSETKNGSARVGGFRLSPR